MFLKCVRLPLLKPLCREVVCQPSIVFQNIGPQRHFCKFRMDTKMDTTSSSGGNEAPKMFTLKKWNAIATWSWDVECDTCAICRVQLMGAFPFLVAVSCTLVSEPSTK